MPLGSKLHIKNIYDDWAQICLSNKHSYKTAFLPSKHIIKIDTKVKDWVSIAEQLLGIPYKLGGRDTMAIDCSALIQLSYEAYGQKIPRNTKDQVNLKKEVIIDLNKLKRGYVVYWEGHVGVMVDQSNCLHANAFHMKVVIEPLSDILMRLGNKQQIIKIMNFNI